MAKKANWQRIKRHRSYTVDEAARALGASKGTVRRWVKSGLPVIDEQRPALIVGEDLIGFLKARAPVKQKCALDECFCFSCKAPRIPAFREAEYHEKNPHGGVMKALCEVCTTVMNKRVSTQNLNLICELLSITRVDDKPDPNQGSEGVQGEGCCQSLRQQTPRPA